MMTRCAVCCHVICLSVLQHYYFYNHRTDPLVYLSVYGFVMTMFSIGLAIGVIIAVGMLFYIQVQCHNHNFSRPQLWDLRERRQENTILESFKDNERERVCVCMCVCLWKGDVLLFLIGVGIHIKHSLTHYCILGISSEVKLCWPVYIERHDLRIKCGPVSRKITKNLCHISFDHDCTYASFWNCWWINSSGGLFCLDLLVLSCLSFQIKSVWKNETGIESWIIDKVSKVLFCYLDLKQWCWLKLKSTHIKLWVHLYIMCVCVGGGGGACVWERERESMCVCVFVRQCVCVCVCVCIWVSGCLALSMEACVISYAQSPPRPCNLQVTLWDIKPMKAQKNIEQ